MIIETPYKQNDTITVKTNAGEELVARFVEEDAETITVQKALAIMATQQGIGLAPFSFTLPQDAKIKMRKSAILFIAKTDSEMAKHYVSNTTGISMAGGQMAGLQL